MSRDIAIQLQGLHCAACAGRAEKALTAVDGVAAASVSIADHTARITLDGADPDALRAVLQQAGYPAREQRIDLTVEGMSCAGCAGRLEKALAKVPGVVSAHANFAARTAQVTRFSGSGPTSDLTRAASDAGYPAQLSDDTTPTEDPAAQEIRDTRRRALIAAALTLPVFVLEMGGHLYPPFHHWIMRTLGQDLSWMLQFVLVTLVLAGPGAVFLRRGLPDLLRGRPDMNSLVALGSLAAWGYSTIALFWPGLLPAGAQAVYFEAAAVIVTLILTGRWLEARARGQAGASIRALAGLQPRSARVERAGAAVETDILEIVPGDIVHLRPGERVAVDGVVIDGATRIDESMMTGEPGTVARQTGDWVTAGTMNGTGTLRYEARRVGRDTVLARIVAMVQQAQGGKLPIQSLADRVVAVFVPAVLAIAALTVALWLIYGPDPALSHALVAGVSVLIIACPCAMGLATPTSIMVGTGRAAQIGVLFRRGEALQRLDSARLVAFDKTGTLTQGRPRLTDLSVTGGWDETAILRLVAAAESRSEHPIASALTEAANDRGLTLPPAKDVHAVEGLGLAAGVEGHSILIGAPRLFDRNGIDWSAMRDRIDRFERSGKTPVLVAVDGAAVAAIAVADTLKPDAADTVRALQARGLAVAMITGDSRGAAQAIADTLGIAHVQAEVLPGGKRDAVQALRRAHGPVVFVGDGLNDAPALAEADTGIAMGTGTDVAIQSAQVVLASGRPGHVVNAIDMSRRTMRNIRQNLFWAFAYNIVLIPVAAGALYPVWGLMLSPMLGAGAMALSSIFVVTNALRLRRFQPEHKADGAALPTPPRADPVAAE